jgi:hypothetical protein
MASRNAPSTTTLTLPDVRAEPTSYYELVAAVVVVWGFGDAVSTLVALVVTGQPAFEVNPFVRYLLTTDPYLLIAMKAAVVLVVGLALVEYREVIQRTPYWRPWLYGTLGLGLFVVAGNLYVGLSPLA